MPPSLDRETTEMQEQPSAVHRLRRLYDAGADLVSYLQSPLLLVLRLHWGWQFFVSGKGKLGRIDQVADWFGGGLGIPFPTANAYAASLTEMIGGMLLIIGLGSRVVAVPLIATMVVAMATAHVDAVHGFWDDPDRFFTQAPMPFLLASLAVLIWGPGLFSIDGLIRFTGPRDDAKG